MTANLRRRLGQPEHPKTKMSPTINKNELGRTSRKCLHGLKAWDVCDG